MSYRLFVDSSNGITVMPEYDYANRGEKVESRHRTREGYEYVYKWGSFERIEFSVRFVNSEFESIVNSWWESNTDLLWMEESGTVVTSVHITNSRKPISEFERPYTNLFKGKIELGTY